MIGGLFKRGHSLDPYMSYLIAIDGSEQSRRTLEYAMDLADDTGVPLVGIHVVGPTVFDDDRTSRSVGGDHRQLRDQLKDAKARGERMLAEAADAARDRGHHLDTHLEFGDPVDRIIDFSDEHDVDAIFVGHRSREARAERFLGSVAKGIAERANVPTTIVR